MDVIKLELEHYLLEKKNLLLDKEIQLSLFKVGSSEVQEQALNTILMIDETIKLNDVILNKIIDGIQE